MSCRSLTALLRAMARMEGRFPEVCPKGAELNQFVPLPPQEAPRHVLFFPSPVEVTAEALELELSRVDGYEDCVHRASCWSCPHGPSLVEDLLSQQGFPLTSGILSEIARPWVSEESRKVEGPRRYPPSCPKGQVLRMLPPDTEIYPDCTRLPSCALCDVAIEGIGDQLVELLEEGWDGPTGRALRERSGYLM